MSVISVENIKEGEHLSYSLPLLIGSCPACQHNFVFVKQGGRVLNTWPICNGRFKIFANLHPGKNEFVLGVVHNESTEMDLKISLYFDLPKCPYFVRPVYIICSDHAGHLQGPEEEDCSVSSAIKRITLSVKLLQSFIAEKLHEQGFKRKTFALENDISQGMAPSCHIFKSKMTLKEAHKLSGSDLWMFFARELMSSNQFSSKNMCKWFAFMSFTRYIPPEGQLPPSSHNEILKFTRGHTALGGGGLALYGTGTLHCWAASLDEIPLRFSDNRKMDRTRFMDDSAYREFLWANYSTGLGAALHELSHTFDLAHTSTGIMARGFDDLHRALSSCHHIPSSSSTLSFISPLSSSPLSNYSLSDESPPSSSSLVDHASPKCSSLPTSPRCHVSSNKDPSKQSMIDGSPKPCCPPGRTSKCHANNESTVHRARHIHQFYEGSKPLPLVVVETSFKKMNISSSHMTTFSDYDGSRTTQVVTRNREGSETTLEISLRLDGRKVIKERIFNLSSKKSKVTLSMTIIPGESKTPSSFSLSSSSSSSSFYSASSSFYSIASSSTRDERDAILKTPECLQRFLDSRYVDGGAHWYRSSALLLNCHKWMNTHPDDEADKMPSMDGFVVNCSTGLYLIELRTVLDGMIFHHYEFNPELELENGSDLQSSMLPRSSQGDRNKIQESIITRFTLSPNEILSLAPPGEDDVGVLVMDRYGNILKRKLTYSQLMSSSRSSLNGSDMQMNHN